jgi:hypothetical protein
VTRTVGAPRCKVTQRMPVTCMVPLESSQTGYIVCVGCRGMSRAPIGKLPQAPTHTIHRQTHQASAWAVYQVWGVPLSGKSTQFKGNDSTVAAYAAAVPSPLPIKQSGPKLAQQYPADNPHPGRHVWWNVRFMPQHAWFCVCLPSTLRHASRVRRMYRTLYVHRRS